MLDSLHTRWVQLLRSLQPEDWKRTFRHPESGVGSLEKNLAIYAWHGKHHVAHVTELKKKDGLVRTTDSKAATDLHGFPTDH